MITVMITKVRSNRFAGPIAETISNGLMTGDNHQRIGQHLGKRSGMRPRDMGGRGEVRRGKWGRSANCSASWP